MAMTDKELKWIKRFQSMGALWQMSDTKSPHVQTSMSGTHVDAYFNSDIVTCQPELLDQIVEDTLLPVLKFRDFKPDWIFTYAPYGILTADAIARKLGVKCGYTNPLTDNFTGFKVTDNSTVLVVSDDIYGGGGILGTIKALENIGAKVIPIVFALANLSGNTELEGREIISAIQLHCNQYGAALCPLCKHGSKALIARSNWEELQSVSTLR